MAKKQITVVDTGTTQTTITDEDRKQIKQILAEMTHCMSRIDLEKESIKDLADTIQTKFSIPKKTVMKIAKTMFNRNYGDVQEEHRHFEELYETLVENKIVDDTEETEEG